MAWHGRSRYAPDTLGRPPHWSRQAACTEDAARELFYPEGDAGLVLLMTAEAKLWCRRCPVQEPCLAEALARSEPFGVWGGLDEKERRDLLRRRAEAERSAGTVPDAGEAAA
jgi:WhiB family redox-sensing transcriptional regulator